VTAKRSTSSATESASTRVRTRPAKATAAAAPVQTVVSEAPPPSRKGQRTRERLLEAAKEIFEEQGFLNARISDIANRAEQSHGSFWYYFTSKEQVFRELAAAVDERLFAPLDDVILAESASNPAPQDRIREATRRHLESYRREARMMDLIEQVSRYDAEVNAMRLVRHKRDTERVARSIRQLQRAKVADPELDPMIVATALGALTQGFAELWFIHKAIDCTIEHAVEQLSRIYENALRLSPPKKRR
jgi:AcrR family transcriptional regulator